MLKQINIILILLVASAFGESTLEKNELQQNSTQSEWKYEEGILVLNNENFDQALVDFKQLVVEFYSPRCPHCRQFAPVYETIKAALDAHGYGNTILAKVNVDENKALVKDYEISYVPYLTFFQSGIIQSKFEGTKSVSDVSEWVLYSYKITPSQVFLQFLKGFFFYFIF